MSHKLLHNVKEIKDLLPVTLTIDATGKCNLKCSFCFSRNHPRKDLDIEIIKSVINDMPSLKSVEVGMGEPFMYSNIEELIDFCYNKGLAIGFSTNGLLLDNVKEETLKKLSFLIISVTDFIDRRVYLNFDWLPVKHSFVYVLNEKTGDPLRVYRRLKFFLDDNKIGETLDVRNDISENAKNSSYAFNYLRTAFKSHPRVIFTDEKEKFLEHSGACYYARLKPFLCNDGNVYYCCVDTVNYDFNKEHLTCKWNEVKEKFSYVSVPIVECKKCSKTTNLKTIDYFLLDNDKEFIN